MNPRLLSIALFSFVLSVIGSASAQAVGLGELQKRIFNLSYDNVDNGFVDFSTVVGIGTFSYDGPLVEGVHLFSDLSNIEFTVEFVGETGNTTFMGPPFDPSDNSLVGISLTDIGNSGFELVFVGDSAVTSGSLDIPAVNGQFSHAPESLFGSPSGSGVYFAVDPSVGLDVFGDYIGVSAVPIPAAYSMFVSGLFCLSRRRRA